jgi:hypothetical protein
MRTSKAGAGSGDGPPAAIKGFAPSAEAKVHASVLWDECHGVLVYRHQGRGSPRS